MSNWNPDSAPFCDHCGQSLEQSNEVAKLRSALERITRTYGSAAAVDIAREALKETSHDR